MAKAAATRNEHPEFENMSDTQLREMIEHARQTLRERVTNRMEEFRAMAREVGFSVTFEKLGEGDGRRRRRSQEGEAGADHRREVVAKYRNPDNPSQTWSGRGKAPRWMDEKLKAGVSREDLLIAPPSSPGASEEAA